MVRANAKAPAVGAHAGTCCGTRPHLLAGFDTLFKTLLWNLDCRQDERGAMWRASARLCFRLASHHLGELCVVGKCLAGALAQCTAPFLAGDIPLASVSPQHRTAYAGHWGLEC